MATTSLSGLYIDIHWDSKERVITVLDLVDTNNEPAMMTRSKRGVDALWTKISAEFSSSWTWSHIQKLMDDAGVRTHSWCRMD